jgi:hypothetical protein
MPMLTPKEKISPLALVIADRIDAWHAEQNLGTVGVFNAIPVLQALEQVRHAITEKYLNSPELRALRKDD